MIATTVASASMTGVISEWATKIMETLGGPGAGLLIALENLFPPLPSEVILPLAGFSAGQGHLSIASAIVWTTLGSVTGALILYWLGAWLGRDRMYSLVRKVPLLRVADVQKAERVFVKYQAKAVLFGRLMPIIRSLISIPAGIERMPLWPFIAFTTLGSLVWNTVLVSAGYLLGNQWHVVEKYVKTFEHIILAAIVVGGIWYIIRRIRARKSGRQGWNKVA